MTLKMNIMRSLTCLTVVGMLLSCSRTEEHTRGYASISGAFALYPLAVQWANAYMQANPGTRIDVSAGGAGKGMTDCLLEMTDFGMLSREVHEAEFAKGAKVYSVAKDGVICDFNAENPFKEELLKHGLTREMARQLWLHPEGLTWGKLLGTIDETPVHVYTRSDACGAAETWANYFGCRQEDLCGTAVFGDPGIAAAIQKDIYGIGFNNIAYAYSAETRRLNGQLAVLPIDGNEDGTISADEDFYYHLDTLMAAIGQGRYPEPPSRTLYLVSHGVPKNATARDFMRFVLDAGQELNVGAGYIPLSEEEREKMREEL